MEIHICGAGTFCECANFGIAGKGGNEKEPKEYGGITGEKVPV